MSKSIAIIAVGYNRVKALNRLLLSIEKAKYGEDRPELIISLDMSDCPEIAQMAEGFAWSHGKKRVVTHSKRLGLKNHILECGQYLNEYDAVIVLEDDVIVSEWYYLYAKQTVDYYYNDNNIAGISLYNYSWNEFVNYPFEAAYSDYDVYFLQLAQSWGQIWMKNQWKDFVNWLSLHEDEPIKNDRIPDNVWAWKNTSWKKYHIKYCVVNNKYFVQPYKSFTTCFSEVGEHCKQKVTMLQVPLYAGNSLTLKLPQFHKDRVVVYDAFFERNGIDDMCGNIPLKDCCFNLYGKKRYFEGKRYVISAYDLPYRVLKTFGLEMKPQEMNVLCDVEGDIIKLYDTSISAKKPMSDIVSVYRYRHNNYDHTSMQIRCVYDSILDIIRLFIKKLV